MSTLIMKSIMDSSGQQFNLYNIIIIIIIIIMVNFIGKIVQGIYQHHCGHSLGNVD